VRVSSDSSVSFGRDSVTRSLLGSDPAREMQAGPAAEARLAHGSPGPWRFVQRVGCFASCFCRASGSVSFVQASVIRVPERAGSTSLLRSTQAPNQAMQLTGTALHSPSAALRRSSCVQLHALVPAADLVSR
jgi:hypothetical protein